MLIARHRQWEFEQFALPGIRIHVHDAIGLLKWKAAQKQIVDQAKDRSVQSNPEGKREQCQQSESGRLKQLPESEAEIGHHNWIAGLCTWQRHHSYRNATIGRSEERRVGKECRSRWS